MVRVWLVRWGWLLLLITSPFLLFPTPLLAPVLLVAPLVVGARLLAPDGRTLFDLPILILLLMVMVSVFVTYDVAVSLTKIAGLLLGVSTYYIVAHDSAETKGRQRWVSGLIVLGWGIAFLGLFATQRIAKLSLLGDVSSQSPNLFGFPGAEKGLNPNEVAGALLWVTPVALALAFSSFQKFRAHLRLMPYSPGSVRAFTRSAKLPESTQRQDTLDSLKTRILLVSVIGLVGLDLAVLLLAQSRSSFLALGLGLITWLLIWLSARWRRILIVITLGLTGIAGVIGALSGVNPGLFWFGSAELSRGRLEIWARAVIAFHDFALTGLGLNAFREIVPILYPFRYIALDHDIAHAHNEFLQAGLDLGVLGLIAFVSLYLIAFWGLRQINQQCQSWPDLKLFRYLTLESRGLTLSLGIGLLAHCFYGLTDAIALGAKPGIIFWLILGLVAGLFRSTQTLYTANSQS